ncbi:MAG: Shikimate dehydrogenase [Pelotomaculum thermopropionicum]|uniref:Shikimate dehydrogenase (NADP(+)) n=1 Tax=Pelotomaculum thermopropionicum TaxID=110500 RepID=A0A101HV25_9FIRM|nr:MAG: Shikimate dehydrogenase [Pelotomaculum thermopropionicum]
MTGGISGRTGVCGIIGCPVEHSFSPAMHNAAFTALGLDFVYVPFQVSPRLLPAAVTAVRALGLVGVNVTVPHKQAVLPFLDELSEAARLAGAVNTIVNRSGWLYGDNTDGKGFLRSLDEGAAFVPSGRTALILGAGGAARAVASELALAGAKKLVVVNRSLERAARLAGFVTEKTGVRAEVVPWPATESDTIADEVLREADLVVQTTSLGMYPGVMSTVPLPYEWFRPGQVACDLVYNPVETLFLRKAARAGATVVDGLGMLLHQGALSFEMWTGAAAPLEVMRNVLWFWKNKES